MKSRVNDDSILFNEIRHSLNKEVHSLDVVTQSKLKQMRFNVIDHALPAQPRIFSLGHNKFPWGMAVAFAVMFSVLVVTQLTPLKLDSLKIASGGDKPVAEELFDEDSEDALKMYEWLYKQYG